jgi:hypothetical protein
MPSPKPTSRSSEGAWLAAPRTEELKTAEDFKQAITYYEKTREQKKDVINRFYVFSIKSAGPHLRRQEALLEKVKKDLNSQVEVLLSVILKLPLVALPLGLQLKRVEFIVCAYLFPLFGHC